MCLAGWPSISKRNTPNRPLSFYRAGHKVRICSLLSCCCFWIISSFLSFSNFSFVKLMLMLFCLSLSFSFASKKKKSTHYNHIWYICICTYARRPIKLRRSAKGAVPLLAELVEYDQSGHGDAVGVFVLRHAAWGVSLVAHFVLVDKVKDMHVPGGISLGSLEHWLRLITWACCKIPWPHINAHHN